ncbi:MAG: RNA polymerase sigma factor [Acidobacteria bacterium]|nr:RNA polymerase sigma factor [Acidobacteriota bacterium]
MPHLNADTLSFPSLPTASCLSASAHFEELALPLFSSIHNFAYYLSRSSADAEDLVQETYLKALRGFDTFEPGSNLRSWMFRILKNTFLNSRTRPFMRFHHIGLEEILENLPARSPDPCEIYLQRVRLLALQSAIERLATVHRNVLVLCDLEGASYREAAEALSIPIGTVMSRLARARKSIRESLRHEATNNSNPENN